MADHGPAFSCARHRLFFFDNLHLVLLARNTPHRETLRRIAAGQQHQGRETNKSKRAPEFYVSGHFVASTVSW